MSDKFSILMFQPNDVVHIITSELSMRIAVFHVYGLEVVIKHRSGGVIKHFMGFSDENMSVVRMPYFVTI